MNSVNLRVISNHEAEMSMIAELEKSITFTLIPVAPIAYGASTKNGFDLSNATIPIKENLGGGVKRDGIPAIDRPRFISPDAVDYLRDDDLVVSVESGGKYLSL